MADKLSNTLSANIATLEGNRAYYCYRAVGNTQNFTITFGTTGETVTAFAFGRYGYTSAKLSMSIITFSASDVYIKTFGDESLSATKNGNVITFTATSTYARIMFISNTTMV